MKVTKKWFTVACMCETQRHTYHVKASNARLAEETAKEKHGSYVWVAGVFEGRLKSVDVIDTGRGQQQREYEEQNNVEEYVEVEAAEPAMNNDITKGLELKP